MLLALLTSAFAATPIIDASVVAADATYPLGYGAPSITYSAATSTYTLYAEAEISAPSGCSVAYDIVSFTSTDGINFGAPTTLLGVDGITPCGVRRPAAVLMDSGDVVLAFEDVSTGAIGFDDSSGTSVVGALAAYSDPALVNYAGVWNLLARRDSDHALVQLSSSNLATWSLVRVLGTGAQMPWMSADMWSPSAGCQDNATWPFWGAMLGSSATDSSWREFTVRSNGAFYIGGAARDRWLPPASPWLSLDYIKQTSSVYTVWFETLDGSGNPQIGVGGPSVITTDPGRDCL